VRFRAVSVDEAHRLLREHEAALAEVFRSVATAL
jgi:hypothetical protein